MYKGDIDLAYKISPMYRESQHESRVEKTLPVQPKRRYPICIGGQRATPPEDCGGPWAFMALEDEYWVEPNKEGRVS
jgi:hypothetical protein